MGLSSDQQTVTRTWASSARRSQAALLESAGQHSENTQLTFEMIKQCVT